MLQTLNQLFNNFWFCLGMAVFSLFALWGALLEGENVWIAVDVFCIVYWVHRAYRTTKPPTIDESPLTPEQTKKIAEITKRFSRELDEVIKEAVDESNKRKDQEANKKEPSDE